MKPFLPPRTHEIPEFLWSADDMRVVAREDAAAMDAAIEDVIARCLAGDKESK